MSTVQEQFSAAEAGRRGYHSVADAVGTAPRRAAVRPRTRRQNVVLTLTATVLGLWFGLGAPSVSPVAPPLSAVSSPAAGDQAAAAPNSTTPAGPANPADPGRADRRDGQFGGFDRLGQQGRHQ